MNNSAEIEEPYSYLSTRISWSAVFAGAILSMGLWILLQAIGLAAGLTSVNPGNPESLHSAGIGTGIWSLIATMIALFIAGLATARIAGPMDREGGALQGAVMWALGATVTIGFFLSTAGMLARAAMVSGDGAARADVNAPANALQVAVTTGKELWWVFFALLLGLISAMLGASASMSRTQRRAQERLREIPVGPTAPVHP